MILFLYEDIVGVTLKVKHRDLVRTSEMSLESPLLLERHYAAYKEKNKVAPHCTFTEVSAYSRKVMIEYSVNRDQGRGHMMQPEFFAVPDPGNARKI